MTTIRPETLKQLRQRAGLSQEALADVARVTKATISRIERGKQLQPGHTPTPR